MRGALAEGPGPYALQAAISSLHSLAPTYADTDWEQIAALYALLARSDPSPVVALNRAVAVSFAEDPERRCRCSRRSRGSSADTRRSTRPMPTCSAGSATTPAARAAYERALELTDNPGERAFLARRRAELG